MELSTTTRGKAKLLWNGYTKHTEKNNMIRWRRQLVFMLTTSQHLLVQLRRFYRVSICAIFFTKYAFIEYLLVLPKYHTTKMYVTKMSCYQNVCYQNVLLPKRPITEMSSYQNVLLPKCQLPKRPLPKCPLPKCLDTGFPTVVACIDGTHVRTSTNMSTGRIFTR